MAKKPQVPRPPRPVQAPKRRSDPRASATGGGLPQWAWIGGGIAAVVIVVGVIIALTAGGGSGVNDTSVAKAMASAGCKYRAVAPKAPKKDPTNYHADVATLTSSTKGLWSTFPPSAGGHYGLWAVWGFYRDPLNPRQVVHNEEHGGVVIWWGPGIKPATVDRLEAFYQEKPEGMVGTPIAGLDSKIALTAWTGDPTKYYRNKNYGIGHIAICKSFDEKAFAAFRDAFRGKGPEGIPLSSDAPGTGPQ